MFCEIVDPIRESNRSLTEIHEDTADIDHIARIVKRAHLEGVQNLGARLGTIAGEEENTRDVFSSGFAFSAFSSSFPSVYLGFGGMREISDYVHADLEVKLAFIRTGEEESFTMTSCCWIKSDGCVICLLFLAKR